MAKTNVEELIKELEYKADFSMFTKSRGVYVTVQCLSLCVDYLKISEQKIDKLTKENERLKESNAGFALAHLLDVAPNADCWDEVIKRAKADTVREMQERLEAEINSSDKYIEEYDGSEVQKAYNKGLRDALKIAKEMLEGVADGKE